MSVHNPQARASTPSSVPSASTSPLDQMSSLLGEVGSDYLFFFTERVRLEEQFADSLALLSARTKALDSGTDLHGYNYSKHSLPSVRRAWRQVRENTEQEVEARRAFAGSLRSEVIEPLQNLKATQTRIANRISEDIKNSHDKYNEQGAILAKLQRTYVRKTSEYMDTANPSASSPSATSRNMPLFPTTSNASASTSPTVADQRREQLAAGINDAKKGLNQFISNLRGDRGEDRDHPPSGQNNPQPGHGQNRASVDERERIERNERERERERAEAGTMRAMKAKREAEDADAKYRLGVFHLESLRINVERVSQGGSNSAADFVQELVLTLQTALAKFAIGLQATSMFTFQMGKRSEEAVEKIDLSKDVNASILALGGSREKPLKPVRYNNFYVGPCKDLIFGVSLQDYAFARGLSGSSNQIPIIVDKCIKAIEHRGLDAEGLYRISPRQQAVQNLVHRIEIDEEQFEFAATEEIYTIAAILKLYLRRLPEPIFRWSLDERIAFSKTRDEHIRNGFIVLRTKLKRQPPIHVATLKALAEHLSMVVLADNKMDARNLSIIFSSIIFGENDVTDVNVLAMMQNGKDTSFEDLLIYAGVIFAEKDYVPPDLTLVGGNESSLARARSGSLSNALAQQQQQTRENRSRSGSITATAPQSVLQGYTPIPVVQPVASSTDFAPQPGGYGHPGSIHRGGHRRKISLRNEQEALAGGEGSDAYSSTSQPSSPPALPPRQYSRSTQDGPMLPPPLPNRPSYVSSNSSSRHNSGSDEPKRDAVAHPAVQAPEAASTPTSTQPAQSNATATRASSSTSSTPQPLGMAIPDNGAEADSSAGPEPSPGLVELARTGEQVLDRLEDTEEHKPDSAHREPASGPEKEGRLEAEATKA